MGLLAWFRRERQWRRDHVTSFSIAAATAADGFTLFQQRCLETLNACHPTPRFERVPAADGSQGYWLEAPFDDAGATLCIYQNEAGIFGGNTKVWFEEWDFRTPEDLIQSVVARWQSRAA